MCVTLYRLASKSPGAMNRLSGLQVPSGLLGDGSLEDHSDKLPAFKLLLSRARRRIMKYFAMEEWVAFNGCSQGVVWRG